MLIDDAKFYVTFTEVGSDALYLARAQINSSSSSIPGYYPNGWSIATYPIVGGEYTWTTLPLGSQLDLTALNAVSILPAQNWPVPYQVKQGSLARVFNPTGDGSRYYATTRDNDALGQDLVQLWSSSSLTRPFAFESTINTSGLSKGAFGWEFGLTHYSDNFPAAAGGTPRIRRSGFDFWTVQNLGSVAPVGSVSASRRLARLSPVITLPAWAQPNTANLTASLVSQAGSTYSWSVTGGTLTAGQGTASITFTAGATPGTTMAVQVSETTAASSCLQPRDFGLK